MEQLWSRVRPEASVEDDYDNVRTRRNRVYVAEKQPRNNGRDVRCPA